MAYIVMAHIVRAEMSRTGGFAPGPAVWPTFSAAGISANTAATPSYMAGAATDAESSKTASVVNNTPAASALRRPKFSPQAAMSKIVAYANWGVGQPTEYLGRDVLGQPDGCSGGKSIVTGPVLWSSWQVDLERPDGAPYQLSPHPATSHHLPPRPPPGSSAAAYVYACKRMIVVHFCVCAFVRLLN